MSCKRSGWLWLIYAVAISLGCGCPLYMVFAPRPATEVESALSRDGRYRCVVRHQPPPGIDASPNIFEFSIEDTSTGQPLPGEPGSRNFDSIGVVPMTITWYGKVVVVSHRIGLIEEGRQLWTGTPNFGDDALAKVLRLNVLAEIDLSQTGVTDAGMHAVREAEQLNKLSLRGVPITDPGLAHLADHPSLRELNLTGTSVTDPGLAHLATFRNLRMLDLRDTRISDEGIQQLRKLTTLERLYVSRTSVTPEGAAELKRALPKLEIQGAERRQP